MFHVEHRKGLVLGLAHGLGVLGRFVLEPKQVEDAMRHDSTELLLMCNTLIVSVFKHTLERNEQISRDHLFVAVVEGDDVRVGVVVQVGAVVGQQPFVGVRHHAQISEGLAVLLGQFGQPALHVAAPFHPTGHVAVDKHDHGWGIKGLFSPRR